MINAATSRSQDGGHDRPDFADRLRRRDVQFSPTEIEHTEPTAPSSAAGGVASLTIKEACPPWVEV